MKNEEYEAEILRLRNECFNCEKAQKRQSVVNKIYEVCKLIVTVCGTVMMLLFTIALLHITLK